MKSKLKICIDPGHGMSNRKRGVYDCGAAVKMQGKEITEAEIVMDWANELRGILQGMGHEVVRTRVDARDPAPVSRRDDIALSYGCDRMISLHCNAAAGTARGTEVYYRGADDKAMAERLSAAVCGVLGIPNRGAKMEEQSQHSALAVLEFDKCWLVELGFIDNAGDRAALLDETKMLLACQALADVITA